MLVRRDLRMTGGHPYGGLRSLLKLITLPEQGDPSGREPILYNGGSRYLLSFSKYLKKSAENICFSAIFLEKTGYNSQKM